MQVALLLSALEEAYKKIDILEGALVEAQKIIEEKDTEGTESAWMPWAKAAIEEGGEELPDCPPRTFIFSLRAEVRLLRLGS